MHESNISVPITLGPHASRYLLQGILKLYFKPTHKWIPNENKYIRINPAINPENQPNFTHPNSDKLPAKSDSIPYIFQKLANISMKKCL